ncbi:MAG: hypothetical protein NUV58_01630 [Candidatus Roizmanbacteria bacterium]|nr:hypothetical protein [Candidatus Roizmanbacteria bacterium]
MIHATGKFGKKLIFLILILGIIVSFALIFPPTNLGFILIMNILVGTFFYFLFKTFLIKKLVITLTVPIFLIITLLSLKLFDPFNLILIISLSIAVGLLIK